MCELGSEYHCYYGALPLLQPTGSVSPAPEVIAQAVALLTSGCGRSKAAACSTLARMYNLGTHVPVDRVAGAHFDSLTKALEPAPIPRPPAAPQGGALYC